MWNPLRLIETLSFFAEVPLLGNVTWLQSLLGMPLPAAPIGPIAPPPPQTLLLGAATPRLQTAQAALVAAQQPVTLESQPPGHWVNTQRVVVDLATVTAADLAALVAAMQRPALTVAPLLRFEGLSEAAVASLWGAIDDGVMGGVSQSGLTLQAGLSPTAPRGYGRFAGQVSTANSGGFASVRTRNFEPPFNLQGWQGVWLWLRGDGQRYKLILRDRSGWDSVAHCASFSTAAEDWQGVTVPFSALQPTFRARTLPTADPLQVQQVCSFQLMLSKFEYNGALNPQFQPGAFHLDVADIAVYRPAPSPQLVAIAPTPEALQPWDSALRTAQVPYQILTDPAAVVAGTGA